MRGSMQIARKENCRIDFRIDKKIIYLKNFSHEKKRKQIWEKLLI